MCFSIFIFYLFGETEGRQANAKHRRQLTTWQVFRQVERRFHSQDSNRQPLPWDLGIPLSSPSSLRSSRTTSVCFSDAQEIWDRHLKNVVVNHCLQSKIYRSAFRISRTLKMHFVRHFSVFFLTSSVQTWDLEPNLCLAYNHMLFSFTLSCPKVYYMGSLNFKPPPLLHKVQAF